MSIEEMIKTILDRGYDDTVPIRLSVISQIKNRVLEIGTLLANAGFGRCCKSYQTSANRQ